MNAPERSAASRWLAPITEVRPGEATTALLLTLNVFLLLTAYYLIKPVREALILSLESGAEYKAYMSGAIAVALVFAVPAYAKLVDRLPRITLLVAVTLSFALELVLFFALSASEALRPYLGLLFYLWVGIFNMMVVAQFWAFANDLYTKEAGERLFPLVALGASVGAAVGSKIAAKLIPRFGVYPMLLWAALLLCVCAGLFFFVDRRENAKRGQIFLAKRKTTDEGGAFRLVLESRYLRLVAAFSVIFSCVNTNGEYLLGKLVKAAGALAVSEGRIQPSGQSDYIGAIYGDFFFYVNVLGVLLQSLVVSRLVKRIGFGAAFLILPVLAFGNATLVAIVPVLAVVRVGKIAENATDYSLNNTLRQTLWLVTSRQMKYKAKQAIDTFFVRIGDVSSALLIWVGVTLLGWSVQPFAVANALLALAWIAVAVSIGREYAKLRPKGEHEPPA